MVGSNRILLFLAIKERQVGAPLKTFLIGQCLSDDGTGKGRQSRQGRRDQSHGGVVGSGAEGVAFSSVDASRPKVLALKLLAQKKRTLVFTEDLFFYLL